MGDTAMGTEDEEASIKNLDVPVEVIGQLSEAAGILTNMVDKFINVREGQREEIEGHKDDLNYLREDLRDVRDSIKRVAKVLLEGNGEKPLIARMATLEQQMAHAREDIDDIEEREDQRQQNETDAEQINSTGKWAVAAAVVSGVVAIATAAMALMGG